MKKRLIIIVLGGLFVLSFIIARLTHGLDYLRVSSASNEPTYHPGSIIFASRYKSPGRNTFVCFKKARQKYIWVFRCIATGGDIVEIKNGVVYLNGQKLEEPYTRHEYFISEKELNTIAGYVSRYHYDVQPINDSLSTISLSTIELKNYHLNLKPLIQEKGIVDSTMFAGFANLKYNPDNFGPIKVPDNSYFLLGDNRHYAYDSRYIGFIKSEDIVSTVLRN